MKISKYSVYSLLCLSLQSYAVEKPIDDWREQGIELANTLQAFLKDEISRPQFETDISLIKQKLSPVGISQMQTQLEQLKQHIVLDGSINQPEKLANSQAPVEINPGFSCYDAAKASEYAICADPQLSAYDLEMSFLYYKKYTKLKNPTKIKQLEVAQSTWRKHRNQCQADNACLSKSYQLRIGQLKTK